MKIKSGHGAFRQEPKSCRSTAKGQQHLHMGIMWINEKWHPQTFGQSLCLILNLAACLLPWQAGDFELDKCLLKKIWDIHGNKSALGMWKW